MTADFSYYFVIISLCRAGREHLINHLATSGQITGVADAVRQTDGFADGNLALRRAENGDRAAPQASHVFQLGEHRTDDGAQLQAAFERVGNVQQQPQLLDDTAIRHVPAAGHDGDGRHAATAGRAGLVDR